MGRKKLTKKERVANGKTWLRENGFKQVDAIAAGYKNAERYKKTLASKDDALIEGIRLKKAELDRAVKKELNLAVDVGILDTANRFRGVDLNPSSMKNALGKVDGYDKAMNSYLTNDLKAIKKGKSLHNTYELIDGNVVVRKMTAGERLKSNTLLLENINKDLDEKGRIALEDKNGKELSFKQVANIMRIMSAYNGVNIFEKLEEVGATEYNISEGWYKIGNGPKRRISEII